MKFNQKLSFIFGLAFIVGLTIGNSILVGAIFAQSSISVVNLISVLPSAQNRQIGDTGIFALNITDAVSTVGIGSFQLDLNYDPQIIRIDSAELGTFLSSSGRTASLAGPIIDNVSGKTSVGGFTLGAVPAGPSGNGILVNINYTVIGSGTGDISLSNLLLTDVSGLSLSSTVRNAEIVVASLASPTPLPSASPEPSVNPDVGKAVLNMKLKSAPVFVGDNISIDVNLSVDAPIIGVDSVILFDPRSLTALGVTDRNLLPISPVSPIVNNGNGTIKFSQIAEVGKPYTGNGGSLVSLNFKVTSIGLKQIGFNYLPGLKIESNVFDTEGRDILIQPSELSFSVIDHAVLQLNLTTPSESTISGHLLEGILEDIASTWSAKLTTDALGLSNIVQVEDIFIGNMKTFMFKSKGFLKERFSLNMASGLNSINLGLLRTGDINDDGIINNVDLSLLYADWFKQGFSDFNKDGVVNTADYYAIVQNFLAVDD